MLRSSTIGELRQVVGREHLVTDPRYLRMWERDGSAARGLPDVVVRPGSTEEVARVIAIAARHGVPVVARGAGTGLSGGAVAVRGGICLQLSRMRRILVLDPEARTALVEPGVANGDLCAKAATFGLFYAPDPSSRRTCTIGGNAAENSSGPGSVRYGTTREHILGMEIVLADGSVHWLGGQCPDPFELALLGLIVGSEGTLCVITKILVRLLPVPAAQIILVGAFPTVAQACFAARAILIRGILPAALEVMDRVTVRAVEALHRLGYPYGAGALLLVEVVGAADEAAELAGDCRSLLSQHGGYWLRMTARHDERDAIWASRRGAVAALSGIGPNYYLHDAALPISRLGTAFSIAAQIGRAYSLSVASTAHAGDGTLHPTIIFDSRDPAVLTRVTAAGNDIAAACLGLGGALSGEYGIGAEKRSLMSAAFATADIEAMLRVKQSFDPAGLLNPGKIFPDRSRGADSVRMGCVRSADWW